MPLVDLTNDNFDHETEKYELMVLDFWAPWCGPCRIFAPTYEEAANRHADILFGRINTESEPELARQFSIFSVPTLLTAKNGVILYARPGALTDVKLEALIKELRESPATESS